MDAVLPLTHNDLDRFELLLRSLSHRVTGLGTLWLVVPDHQLEAIRGALPQQERLRVRLEGESAWLPELELFPRAHGWYRQMLLKLEAANRVQSEFYLTLDADVIAARPVDLEALTASGRAPCHVDRQDLHPKWYGAAQDLLGLTLPRQCISHGVTPALLHAPSVRSLHQHLSDRWTQGRYGHGLRGVKQRLGKLRTLLRPGATVEPWRALLLCSRPWAEYALYFSYLEATGNFEHYFDERDQCLYSIRGSVWSEQEFAAWDPKAWFDGEGPPYFVVVQSNTHVPASVVRERVERFLT